MLKTDPAHFISDHHILFEPNFTTLRVKTNMLLIKKMPMCVELACNYMRFWNVTVWILTSSIYADNITLLELDESYVKDSLLLIYSFGLFYFFNIIFIYREVASYTRLLKCTSLKWSRPRKKNVFVSEDT